MSRFSATPHGVAGQVLCLPDKEFRYLRTVPSVTTQTPVFGRSTHFWWTLTIARESGLSHPAPRSRGRARRIVSEDSGRLNAAKDDRSRGRPSSIDSAPGLSC
jgi:hypothetical protein